MTKVSRMVVHEGDWYEVSCAVRADGISSPVAEFLEALKERKWTPGADESSDMVLDEQVKDYQWFVAKLEYFADYGEFPQNGNWNQLMNGIWEIKRGAIRVSFFDTDGHGNYSPKIVARVHTGGGGYCPLPEFDDYVRLGTVFLKGSGKTPPSEIDLAEKVREEDLAHDRCEWEQDDLD